MKKIIIILGLLIIGCGGRQSDQTLEFWQFWTDPKAKPVIDSIVEQFESENPGWTVNVTDLTWSDGHQKIVVAFGAGNPPDLLELGSDWIAEFAAGHALSEIEVDTSKFLLTEPGIFENKIYAHPWFLASRILFFNKTLLEQANQKIPANWDEMYEAIKAIDALDESISGFGANSAEQHRLYKKFLPFVWSCGGTIIEDGRINLDNPEVLKALTFYQSLTEYSHIEKQRYLEDSFIEGNLGCVISGGWLIKRLEDNDADFDYEMVPMIPETADQQGYSFAGGEYLTIPYKSQKKEAARKLIDIILRPSNIAALCDSVGFGFGPYKARVREDLTPQEQTLFSQLESSRSTPVHPRWLYVEAVIEKMVESVTLGKSTPEQAIEDAQNKINETLNY